jgi:hypothetical protein
MIIWGKQIKVEVKKNFNKLIETISSSQKKQYLSISLFYYTKSTTLTLQIRQNHKNKVHTYKTSLPKFKK